MAMFSDAPPQLAVESSPAPDDVCLSGRYAQVAQGLMPSLPSTCHLLSPPDIKLVSEHPIAAGGFANIWEGTHGGRKVVLKSYRCYVSFDAAQVVAVRCNPLCLVPIDDSLTEVLQRSSHMDSPSRQRRERSTAPGSVLD